MGPSGPPKGTSSVPNPAQTHVGGWVVAQRGSVAFSSVQRCSAAFSRAQHGPVWGFVRMRTPCVMGGGAGGPRSASAATWHGVWQWSAAFSSVQQRSAAFSSFQQHPTASPRTPSRAGGAAGGRGVRARPMRPQQCHPHNKQSMCASSHIMMHTHGCETRLGTCLKTGYGAHYSILSTHSYHLSLSSEGFERCSSPRRARPLSILSAHKLMQDGTRPQRVRANLVTKTATTRHT